MTYFKPLPHIDNVRWLAKLAGPYPTTRQAILETAELWKFSDNTLEFLMLFPPDEEFTDHQDFLSRCEELEMLIREERAQPVEVLNSPQD